MRSFVHDTVTTRILFGRGTVKRVGEELAMLGGHRTLLLSTSGRSALAEQIRSQIGDSAAGVFAGAVEHTPVEVTERAIARMHELNADSIVSLGGGSTTGLGKALVFRKRVPHLVPPRPTRDPK